jgi:hypothetical protein
MESVNAFGAFMIFGGVVPDRFFLDLSRNHIKNPNSPASLCDS